MDDARKRAYHAVLASGLLHIKWDLACLFGGFSWIPWRRRAQQRSAERAAHRAAAFHNLATFVTWDFDGFSEERFWQDVHYFTEHFPECDWGNYRGIFEASLRGEKVSIISPNGNVPRVAIPAAEVIA